MTLSIITITIRELDNLDNARSVFLNAITENIAGSPIRIVYSLLSVIILGTNSFVRAVFWLAIGLEPLDGAEGGVKKSKNYFRKNNNNNVLSQPVMAKNFHTLSGWRSIKGCWRWVSHSGLGRFKSCSHSDKAS